MMYLTGNGYFQFGNPGSWESGQNFGLELSRFGIENQSPASR